LKDYESFNVRNYFRKKDELYMDLTGLFSSYGNLVSREPFESDDNSRRRKELFKKSEDSWRVDRRFTPVLDRAKNSRPAPYKHYQLPRYHEQNLKMSFPKKHEEFLRELQIRGFGGKREDE
jgi:hypothetical protein